MVLLKDRPKLETLCDQFAEASLKWLRINEVGAYSTITNEHTPIEEVFFVWRGRGIRPIGRKAVNRKANVTVEDPVLDLMTK